MTDLILRPSTLNHEKPWALQLRRFHSVGPIEYETLTRVSEALAREIIEAGAASWLHGEPKDVNDDHLAGVRDSIKHV